MSKEPEVNYPLARATALGQIGQQTSMQINNRLPETIRASPNIFGLDIRPHTTPDDLLVTGDMFARATVLGNYTTGMNRFSLGDIINHLSKTTQDDIAQVVEDMQLDEKTGLAVRTIYTWSLTAGRIRLANRHSNLAWSTFVLVASYKGVNPDKDPIGHVKFEDARMRILDMVHDDPESRGLEWIREQMKKLQKAGSVNPKIVVTKRDLFEYGAKMLCIQAQLGPADLAKMGKTQGDVTNAIEELQNELINRGIIDPGNLVWPNLSGELGGVMEDAVESDSDEEGDEK